MLKLHFFIYSFTNCVSQGKVVWLSITRAYIRPSIVRTCIHFFLHYADTLGARASARTTASTAASAAAAEAAPCR